MPWSFHFPSKQQLISNFHLHILTVHLIFDLAKKGDLLNFTALAFCWRAPMGKWLMVDWPIRARALLLLRHRNMNQLLYTIVSRPCCLTLARTPFTMIQEKSLNMVQIFSSAVLYFTQWFTGTPSSRVRIVVAWQKYYKGLYGDFSDRYLGVKNSNTNLLCFLNIFGR